MRTLLSKGNAYVAVLDRALQKKEKLIVKK